MQNFLANLTKTLRKIDSGFCIQFCILCFLMHATELITTNSLLYPFWNPLLGVISLTGLGIKIDVFRPLTIRRTTSQFHFCQIKGGLKFNSISQAMIKHSHQIRVISWKLGNSASKIAIWFQVIPVKVTWQILKIWKVSRLPFLLVGSVWSGQFSSFQSTPSLVSSCLVLESEPWNLS